MNNADMMRGLDEARFLNKHLLNTHQRLKAHKITKNLDEVTVTYNGLGEFLDLQVEEFTEATVEKIKSAIIDCQKRAQAGYNAFIEGRK
jgi:hypothetical protein